MRATERGPLPPSSARSLDSTRKEAWPAGGQAGQCRDDRKLGRPGQRIHRPLLRNGDAFPLLVKVVILGNAWRHGWLPAWFPLAFAGIFLVTPLRSLRIAVVLTDGELIVVRVRSRHVPWSGILAIRWEPVWFGYRAVLYLRTGQRLVLPYPAAVTRLGRRRFLRELALIEQSWVRLRGADWTLPPRGPISTWRQVGHEVTLPRGGLDVWLPPQPALRPEA